MRDDKTCLEDIIEAIEKIEKYASRGREAFLKDELIQTWIIHHIQVIGEASRNLSENFRNTHSHIPWRQIYTMRNILVHDYFGIDLEEVWAAVENDLPDLKQKIQSILQ